MKVIGRNVAVILIGSLFFFSCGKKFMFQRADLAVKALTLEEKIGQLLMVAVPGIKMNKVSRDIIKKYKPGGIILFGYNIKNKIQLKRYLDDFQGQTRVPLFVSIDQEGGRVIRISSGVEQFPGNMAAGSGGDEILVKQWGRILGLQLRMLGVNMNLAPVVDVNNNAGNPVINIRSFGADVSTVSKLARAYVMGLQESRCIAVAKHFPGHGDTNKDSHVTLPVINYTIDRLKRIEYPPFVSSINAGVEGVMTAHIAYPKILKNYNPATVSPYFLKDVLRKEMKFKGLVLTDDMEMHAISRRKKMDTAAVDAFNAGADIILISSYGKNIKIIFDGLKRAVENGTISKKRLNDSVRKILEIKLRYKLIKMDDKTGSVDMHTFNVKEKEKNILAQAQKVNRRISEKALYYRGQASLMKKKLHLVTKSPTMKKELRGSKVRVWSSVYKCMNYIKKMKIQRDAVIVFHMNIPRPRNAKTTMQYIKKNKVSGILLSTGNPFPLITAKVATNYLFTFSPTSESLKAAARCLRGSVPYKKKIGFSLGFKK